MVQKGLILKDDADLDYAIGLKQLVEIRVGGEVDYEGRLYGYTADTVVTDKGHRYMRRLVEVRVK